MEHIQEHLTSLEGWEWKLLLAVPLIPLMGYVIQIFFGKKLPRQGDFLILGGMFAVMCITVYMFFSVALGFEPTEGKEGFFALSRADGFSWNWLYSSGEKADGLNLTTGLLYDGLGAAMLAAVGVVCFFVHLFSTGYMQGDRRYHIFFANISLFSFAMLGLVLSDNILFLFIFWELMGLMSYLLIGHFSQDPTSPRIKQAAAACKKAFMTTRVGDTCLLFGMAMFYVLLPMDYNDLVKTGLIAGDQISGSFSFTDLWTNTSMVVEAHGEYPFWMTVAGLFVFGGTVGKSAQFPLHIWLPDAMEGPTPVSAMIHAATMVAAGVFLLGRTFPLMSPTVLAIVAAVGAVTALFAATIGCTVNDIKGVLAYSTISQLGFMVAAIGTAGLGLVAGLFHMVTHAFFKACLFLSAGSVIHGCHHEQDMRKMGGLRKKMPVTFVCMLICTLAIAGTPLFSGFYSKDRIIQSAFAATKLDFNGGNMLATLALPLAAALTTFYMFRLIFMTFFGQPRDQHIYDHAHESPRTMTWALMGLAAGGLFVGHFWLIHPTDIMGGQTWFTDLVRWETMYPGVDLLKTNMVSFGDAAHIEHVYHGAHLPALYVSLFVLALGFAVAVQMYLRAKWSPAKVTSRLGLAYEWVRDKYYIDELVHFTVVRSTNWLARVQTWIDIHLVDGTVLLVGRSSKALGFIGAWIDTHIVDGAVNWTAHATQAFGSVIRLFQTGRIQQYVSFAVAGGILVAALHLLT